MDTTYFFCEQPFYHLKPKKKLHASVCIPLLLGLICHMYNAAHAGSSPLRRYKISGSVCVCKNVCIKCSGHYWGLAIFYAHKYKCRDMLSAHSLSFYIFFRCTHLKVLRRLNQALIFLPCLPLTYFLSRGALYVFLVFCKCDDEKCKCSHYSCKIAWAHGWKNIWMG